MKILIISHYYPPEPGAPQARISEMAKVWKDAGCEVIVYTCFPNHPTGIIPDKYKGKLFSREDIDGIKVLRHWVFASVNKGIIKKTCSHLSFMLSVVLLSLLRDKKPDIIVVTSPTFFSVISAYLFSIIRRVPFIFEVRDLWPGIFVELNVLKNRALIKILETIELYLYRKAIRVITVTEGFKTNIASRGIPSEKIKVITNGVDLNRFSSGEKNINLIRNLDVNPESFIVLYAGAHGISHALSSVLHAALICQNKDENIHFLFVGEGAEKDKLIVLKNKLKLKNVTFQGAITKDLMKDLYCSVDICLVPLRNISGFKTFIPSKMFEIMACQKPIIASLFGEAQTILENSKGAVITSPEDHQELSNAILDLYGNHDKMREMGEHGALFVRNNYDRENLAKKYLEIIKSIV